jgi:hypothetical protein
VCVSLIFQTDNFDIYDKIDLNLNLDQRNAGCKCSKEISIKSAKKEK